MGPTARKGIASQLNHTELDFTGERVVLGKTPRSLVLEHLVRYRLALTFVHADSKVLDVGCGTGYGTALLAEKAAGVAGVDNAQEAVGYARKSYVQRNLFFACADCRSLPFREHCFDQAVLFEVIEHISEQTRCLGEIRRVLTPEGILIVSTPNSAGPTKAIDGPNPFHEKELQEYELLELLRPHFAEVRLFYQHAVSASRIEAGSPASHGGAAEVVEDYSRDSAPKYFVAVCSDRRLRLPSKKLLAVEGIEDHVAIVEDLRQQEREIARLKEEVAARDRRQEDTEREHAKNLAAHQDVIARLKEEVAARDRWQEDTEREHAKNLAAHQDVIARLKEEVAAVNSLRAALENQNESRRMELEWLYRWLPINRLAHRLFYGKGLRRRILRKLGFKV